MKYYLSSLLILLSTLVFGSESPSSSVMGSESQSITIVQNDTENPNETIEQSTDSESNKKRRKKKKKKATWKYIVSGVGLALVIVFWVLTGGEGWNSRG